MVIQKMYQCSVCECLFDAGELTGGVCSDCLKEEALEEIRREQRRKMLAKHMVEQQDGQLLMMLN